MSEEEIKNLREVAYHVEKMLNMHHDQFEKVLKRLEEIGMALHSVISDTKQFEQTSRRFEEANKSLNKVIEDVSGIKSELKTASRYAGGVSGATAGATTAAIIEIAKYLVMK